MSRMYAEHLMSVVEGATVFGMVVFVPAIVRDLWLSVRSGE
jgi:hypothetical protein